MAKTTVDVIIAVKPAVSVVAVREVTALVDPVERFVSVLAAFADGLPKGALGLDHYRK